MSILGYCYDIEITAIYGDNVTFDYKRRDISTPPTRTANWSTDVWGNLLTEIVFAVGRTGRVALKSQDPDGGGLEWIERDAADHTTYRTYTGYPALVRDVNGTTVDLAVDTGDPEAVLITIDWSDPGDIWLGHETTITADVDSQGTAYLHDATLVDNGIVANTKWPDNLSASGPKDYRVTVIGYKTVPVVTLADANGPLKNSAGHTRVFDLPTGMVHYTGELPRLHGSKTIKVSPKLQSKLKI